VTLAPQRIIQDSPPEPLGAFGTPCVLPALRDLFSQHHGAIRSGPETLARMLQVLCFLPYRPEVAEVEAALEALAVEGEVLA
jgi:hypothetical protein